MSSSLIHSVTVEIIHSGGKRWMWMFTPSLYLRTVSKKKKKTIKSLLMSHNPLITATDNSMLPGRADMGNKCLGKIIM